MYWLNKQRFPWAQIQPSNKSQSVYWLYEQKFNATGSEPESSKHRLHRFSDRSHTIHTATLANDCTRSMYCTRVTGVGRIRWAHCPNLCSWLWDSTNRFYLTRDSFASARFISVPCSSLEEQVLVHMSELWSKVTVGLFLLSCCLRCSRRKADRHSSSQLGCWG